MAIRSKATTAKSWKDMALGPRAAISRPAALPLAYCLSVMLPEAPASTGHASGMKSLGLPLRLRTWKEFVEIACALPMGEISTRNWQDWITPFDRRLTTTEI